MTTTATLPLLNDAFLLSIRFFVRENDFFGRLGIAIMNVGKVHPAFDWPESTENLKKLVEWKERCPVVQEGRFYVRELGKDGSPVLKSVSGLLRPLGSCFWTVGDDAEVEDNDDDDVVDDAEAPSKPPPAAERGSFVPKQLSRNRRYRGAFSGTARGSMIHRQLRHFVELDSESFLKVNGGPMHPWTAVVLKELVDRGWMPAFAEFPVHDPRIGVATAVDLVCLDRTGRVLFVELKTGYTADFRKSSGRRMHGALSSLEDTPLERALVQLSVSVLMALRELRLAADRFECLVVRVDRSAPELVRVPHEFLYREATDAYLEMARAILRKRGERRRRPMRKTSL